MISHQPVVFSHPVSFYLGSELGSRISCVVIPILSLELSMNKPKMKLLAYGV